jgi:hypothetical protein
VLTLVAALFLTVASAWIRPATDEHAMYGWEGPPGPNYKPRPVAGWPAPFIADSPHTSVILQIGFPELLAADCSRSRPGGPPHQAHLKQKSAPDAGSGALPKASMSEA